jgi:hypothetical protein
MNSKGSCLDGRERARGYLRMNSKGSCLDGRERARGYLGINCRIFSELLKY